MRHLIVSDTHAPTTVKAIINHLKKKPIDVDAIVINGDLLGIFSMDKSSVHRKKPMSKEHIEEYLMLGAPKFYQEFKKKGKLDEALALAYVKERYEWCFETIKNFAEMKKTIFNLGNHESRHHFLVLQELPFLLGLHAPRLKDEDLMKIYTLFELRLSLLEKSHDFVYIRNKPLLIDKTLILGIPGESHGTTGQEKESLIQEEKTKQLILQCKPLLKSINRIIIYNHTQGDYNRSLGVFKPASPSLKKFMGELPEHIKERIFVQSHNHWNYTQFLKSDGFHFILNNAGLHEGIFNLLDVNKGISVFDIQAGFEELVEVHAVVPTSPPKGDTGTIKRHYKNYIDIYMRRKTVLFD